MYIDTYIYMCVYICVCIYTHPNPLGFAPYAETVPSGETVLSGDEQVTFDTVR